MVDRDTPAARKRVKQLYSGLDCAPASPTGYSIVDHSRDRSLKISILGQRPRLAIRWQQRVR